ncbi:anti-sigma factor antagonist [Actinomarinicola tropica]|uniref:Anti-sigma factor antagonist n=1 Tax=Actinomarinicola tropica TaxID=2789776 RepID=A0A5Q2RQ96_9ACTN|nr:anti-sigma factor antagonist [Actinomarinicola tropica]
MGDGAGDVGAPAHPGHRGVGVAQRGVDVVADPVGVGGEQDVRHGRHATRRPRAASIRAGRRGLLACPPTIDKARSATTRETTRVLEIQIEETADHTVCRPVGELDAYTVGQFREALGDLASAGRLLIDLSEVPFMDSAGLGALIGGIRRAREAGGEVAVACSRPTLTRLLHTTGFDRIVPVTETLDEAVAALAASGDASA